MSNIKPVILCGGVGTRLWPVSRTASPKQFQRINGDSPTTFFQATVQRHSGEGYDEPIILASNHHLSYVTRQLSEIQQDAEIILEPSSRNTAPALAAAALWMAAENPGQVILSLPSDHLIAGDLSSIVLSALPAAEEGKIVVFGIKPRYAETGYGYILDGGADNGCPFVRSVAGFIEKPHAERANKLIEGGNAYWASGISLFRADVLLKEFETQAPDILENVRRAIAEGQVEDEHLTLSANHYAACNNLSCEYAIYERCSHMALAPANIVWDDVGAWESFHRNGEKNADGNVTSGDVLLMDTTNSFVRSSKRLITVIGMHDLVVVDTEDALLITDRAKTQNVKSAVDLLSKASRQEVVAHAEKVEGWGATKQLLKGNSFLLSHLRVVPEQQAVLSPAEEKDRYLTLVEGLGEASMNGVTQDLTPGSSFLVPRGTICVLRNAGTTELHLLEMAIGNNSQSVSSSIPALTERAKLGVSAAHG